MNGKELRAALENLLFNSLGLRQSESFAFVYDGEYRALREPLERIAAEFGFNCFSLQTSYDGTGPVGGDVRSILLGRDYSVILFGLANNIWHTPERKKAKYELDKRLASLVCAPQDFGTGPSLVEVHRLSQVARSIKPLLKTGAELTVETPAGTHLSAIIGTPFCEDGRYEIPGTGGDFPPGEVGFGPVEGSVNGEIVYDLKVQHIGILKSPLACRVIADRIVDVSGENRDDFLRLCESRGDVLRFISEVSIGLNPLGVITSTPAFIPEEKCLGTVHCGHEGNASYGRRTGPHLDGVMKDPTVRVGSITIVDKGSLPPDYLTPDLIAWLNKYR